jgi:hypothetical protein
MELQMSDLEQIKQVVAYMGGTIEYTGGGCTHIEFDHGETVTEIRSVPMEDVVPESWDEQAEAFFYEKSEGPEGGEVDGRGTLRKVLLELYGPIEGETLPAELAVLRE